METEQKQPPESMLTAIVTNTMEDYISVREPFSVKDIYDLARANNADLDINYRAVSSIVMNYHVRMGLTMKWEYLGDSLTYRRVFRIDNSVMAQVLDTAFPENDQPPF